VSQESAAKFGKSRPARGNPHPYVWIAYLTNRSTLSQLLKPYNLSGYTVSVGSAASADCRLVTPQVGDLLRYLTTQSISTNILPHKQYMDTNRHGSNDCLFGIMEMAVCLSIYHKQTQRLVCCLSVNHPAFTSHRGSLLHRRRHVHLSRVSDGL
jgi:hypothetical protein